MTNQIFSRLRDIGITLIAIALSYWVFSTAERVRVETSNHAAIDQAIIRALQPPTPTVK